MLKRTGLTIALLSWALPTADLLAAGPSNDKLYDMILNLKKELSLIKSENKQLRDTLKEKQAQETATQAAPAVQAAPAATAPAGDADGILPKMHKETRLNAKQQNSYLIFESPSGDVQYKIDGRIMLDGGAVSGTDPGNAIKPNMEFRRVRLALKTTLYRDWSSEFDFGFGADTSDTTVTSTAKDSAGKAITIKSSASNKSEIKPKIDDMWIAYSGFYHTTLKIGNQKPPFSIDEVTTSRWSTFLETSMVSGAFAPGRRIGLSATNWDTPYFVGIGIFGDEPQINTQSDGNGNERFGWAARGAYRPYVSSDEHRLLHVGANYLSLAPFRQESNVFSYNTRPEAHFVDYKFLNTDDIKETKDATTWGLELAGKWDKFFFQGEYLKSKVNKIDGSKPSPEFPGWYVMASYFLTEDERPYNLDDGEFGPVVPNGPWGGFELAARYSVLDLNDPTANVAGGEAKNTTIGANWYANNNVIFRINYIHVDQDANANKKGKGVGNDNMNIYGMRAEYLF